MTGHGTPPPHEQLLTGRSSEQEVRMIYKLLTIGSALMLSAGIALADDVSG